MNSSTTRQATLDSDLHKGAVEGGAARRPGCEDEQNTSLSGQLPHRGVQGATAGQDTDFPEPGESPEHSGQHS
jgi:hypothetical protein